MNNIRKRQIHLDFHTNGTLSVGDSFSKEQFQAALKAGHINSITVFSKCHHGYSYHPTEVNEMHPGLKFDLLGAQLEACKEIGVNAPVYISAGLDEKEAEKHPEYLLCFSPDPEEQKKEWEQPHFHFLCFNSPYLDLLAAQAEEVMRKYNPCGIFFDIVGQRVCYCENCRRLMKEQGLDINNEDDRNKFARITLDKYFDTVNRAVRKYSDTATIFHNAGHLPKGDYDFINRSTHQELESLPTGGWGYDHFSLSAAYARTLENTDFLGMTGKFHHSWGEFGGFKHPNALIYETSLSVANGAGCSIGDQLHPLGEMNPATYNLIGKAYSLIEEKEPWLNGAENLADIAVLSAEALTNSRQAGEKPDTGANRMLLEKKYLYNFIDLNADLSKYKMLILPDIPGMTDGFIDKLKKFISEGGKVIATGESIVKDGKFVIDCGAEYKGENEYNPAYFVPAFDTVNGKTEYVMKAKSYLFEPNGCEVVGYGQNPYFNRTREHFCSHAHAPNNPDSQFPAVLINGNIAYVGWDIFTAYANEGHLIFKEIFAYLAERLLGDGAAVKVEMPDRGIVTLTEQASERRRILHLLFAHTTVRGRNTEVIESSVPLCNVKCSVKAENAPKRVVLVPEGKEIDFVFENGRVNFTVPEVTLHQMVSIEE